MAKRIISEAERLKRSEGAKRAKARLKEDPVAYAQFKAKTSIAVKTEWQKDQSNRINNIGKAVRLAAASMTNEQRKQKFGWMNAPHVSPERKREIWEQSLKKWYDTATREELAVMLVKRTEAITLAFGQAGKLYDNALPEDHQINKWFLKLKPQFKVNFDEVFEV